MKAHLLLGLLAFSSINAFAQTYTPFTTSADIDIANIKATSLVHGDMWNNPTTAAAKCEYPRGSGKHVGYNAGLWLGGYNSSAALRMSTTASRQNGNDFWPGPLDTTSTTPAQIYQKSQNWARIWKVSALQIDSFRHGLYMANTIPADMKEWPAIGNPNAKGAGSVSLTISRSMAPFVDVNTDGIYNVSDGDYPRIKGDQMLWYVFNDYGPTRSQNALASMMVEIKHSAYAYKRNTVAGNVIFYEYEITNLGLSLPTFRIGMGTDFDLGNSFDDYTGFDSSHRMGFNYNASPIDGSGQPTAYGLNPPIVGLTVVEFPGDLPGSFIPTGSYMAYTNNSNTPNGNPVGALEVWRLMNSTNRLGTALATGSKYSTYDREQCDSNLAGSDRRFVIASGDISFPTGSTKKIAVALVVSDSGGTCPNVNFTGLHNVADTAWNLYHNPPTPAGLNNPGAITALHIYPNPVNTFLYIDQPAGSNGTVAVYDAVGRSLGLSATTQGNKITVDTRSLTTGVYNVIYRSATLTANSKFVKE